MNISLNITDLALSVPIQKTQFSLNDILRDYCVQIDIFIGYIFILSLFYLIIEYFLLQRLENLGEFILVKYPILNMTFSYSQIKQFFNTAYVTSRMLMMILSFTGFYLYASQSSWKMPMLQWVMIGMICFCVIGGLYMQYKEKRYD